MFFDREDDDHDFLSPGGSKLGALFGVDKAGNQGGNESLTYTAQKQPKKKESTPPAKGAPSVAFAVAVHTYKYVDNKYASQGKMGAAILANHATNEYSILMYVTQQQKVTTAKISPAFVFTCQANNYANFYDDARQSWSILFENEQNAIDFAKHVCLTKALSTGPTPTNLTTQDLKDGEGGALESGDSVEVKYTGWLLTNNTFGNVFDSNAKSDKLFRFKIGAGKVIKGWETGVIGMKKNGKRLLVIPPGLAYGNQGMGDRVPANSTLIFEVEIVRVKFLGRDSSPSPAPPPQQSVPVQAPSEAPDEMDDDQTVKGRTKSISDQLSHSPTQDTSKAKLISRMAKMGKPMLPFSGAVPANTESDDEPVPESPQPLTSNPNPGNTQIHRPVPVSVAQQPQQQQQQLQQQQQPVTVVQSQQQPAFLQNLPGAQQMALYQPQQNFAQQQQPAQQTMYPPGYQSAQMFGNQPQQAVPGTSFPPYIVPGLSQGQDMMLMSETRQQNTEVRLSLSKVSDKMDQVLQKLDHAHSPASSTSMLPNMETSVLLHNITRIVQENERLKKDVFEKSGKIETQNDKISELLQRNQSYVEKSQVLMEQRNEGLLSSANQSQNKLLTLEQEKVKLTKDLTDAMSQISTFQLEIATLKKKEFELSQQVNTTDKEARRKTEELESLKSQHEDDESRLKELQRLMNEEKLNRKTVENKIGLLQEEISDLQTAKQLVEKNLTDRKKKAAEERRQMEDEVEDIKLNLEAEIQSLKEKLRKQKTSASTTTQEQISQLEEEINNDWQKKSDKLLAAAADKHSRALQSVKEEKQELEAQVKELEKRIQGLKSSSSGSDQKLSELQKEVEELSVWKDKYDSLRANAATMKERYESRIQEVEEERDSLDEKVSTLETEVEQLKSSSSGAMSNASSLNLLDEVKKIMNTVYREMKETFESENSYTGAEILSAILGSIKSTTLSLMNRTKEQSNAKEEESEEEEDDDEEEESEEEEEEVDEEEEEDAAEERNEEDVKSEIKKESSEVQQSSVESESFVHVDVSKDSKSDTVEAEKEESVPSGDKVKDNLEVKVTDDGDAKVTDDGGPKVTDGSEQSSPDEIPEDSKADAVIDKPIRKADSLDDLLDSALENKPVSSKPAPIVTLISTEPPPLWDASSDEEEGEMEKIRKKSIFAEDGDDDDIVADTLGLTKDPLVNGTGTKTDKKPDKSLLNEEDLKPAPPPPLFGDDDDDDDLDWLG